MQRPSQQPESLPTSISGLANPGNLNTTIGNEYRLLARGMRQKGHASGDILRWLESVRQTSVAATFIPPWSPPTKEEFLHTFARFFE